MKPTLSVIIPALDEEGNLAGAVESTRAAISDHFADHEILIFDDGSTDRTGAVADDLAAHDPHVRVTHNGRNRGFGYSYRKGVELAQMQYIAWVAGDNEGSPEAVATLFAQVGRADIIAAHTLNGHIRPRGRQMISGLYTRSLNLLFSLNLKYYNGLHVVRADLVKSVPITSTGFACMSEVLIRLVRSGHSYLEVGTLMQARSYGSSKAVRWKNILDIARTLTHLLWTVYVRNHARYGKHGQPVLDNRGWNTSLG